MSGLKSQKFDSAGCKPSLAKADAEGQDQNAGLALLGHRLEVVRFCLRACLWANFGNNIFKQHPRAILHGCLKRNSQAPAKATG